MAASAGELRLNELSRLSSLETFSEAGVYYSLAAFRKVAITFAIGRFILGLQYLVVLLQSRPTWNRSTMVHVFASVLSGCCWSGASILTSSVAGRIVLGFVALFVEAVLRLTAAYMAPLSQHRQNSPLLERFSLITIVRILVPIVFRHLSLPQVVLGEGVLTVSEAALTIVSG